MRLRFIRFLVLGDHAAGMRRNVRQSPAVLRGRVRGQTLCGRVSSAVQAMTPSLALIFLIENAVCAIAAGMNSYEK
jgi:hypothetical protein